MQEMRGESAVSSAESPRAPAEQWAGCDVIRGGIEGCVEPVAPACSTERFLMANMAP
jgi:hypothetical protein